MTQVHLALLVLLELKVTQVHLALPVLLELKVTQVHLALLGLKGIQVSKVCQDLHRLARPIIGVIQVLTGVQFFMLMVLAVMVWKHKQPTTIKLLMIML